ncbi:response regulator [Dyadobacter jiangsuensis]
MHPNSSLDQPCKIMVVDDNCDLALITSLLLQKRGFVVSTCGDGHTCLQTAEAFGPDLILLDIDMPVMDGITTCQLLRIQPWGKDIPTIAYSGGVKKPEQAALIETTFDASLTKPADFEDMVSLILDTIHLKRASR